MTRLAILPSGHMGRTAWFESLLLFARPPPKVPQVRKQNQLEVSKVRRRGKAVLFSEKTNVCFLSPGHLQAVESEHRSTQMREV